MSEGGGEALGPPFVTSGGFQSSQPPTPSSTVPDASGGDPNSKSSSSSGLPPFSSFTATELAEGLGSRLGPEGFGTEAYAGRLLDFPSWGYYEEGLTGRLLDRGDGIPMLIPQPQYRPWESKPMEAIAQDGFTKTYDYPGSPASKLPSFQSQFNAFPEQNGETISLTTLTPAPPSPTTNSSGLPSFHTLSTVAVNPRGYPLVPAPVQAREIPTIQQQFIDERHIHLFQSPATLNNAQYHQIGLTSANSSIIQGNFVTHPQPPQQATLLTVVKTEPVAIVATQLHQQPHIYQNSNTASAIMEHDSIKVEDNSSSPRGLPDSRKKERRKIRASSIDNSIESDGVGSSSVESSGQVAAISSTASFKSPLMQHQNMGSMNMPLGGQHGENEECENGTGEKQTKKKRKRCGECIGCQRKDNCGDCAPCRNDKSHQICKMRRCEKLTDKKVSSFSLVVAVRLRKPRKTLFLCKGRIWHTVPTVTPA